MSFELKPGVYRLTKTVQNPKADRRKKREWTALPEWERGDMFVVFEKIAAQTIPIDNHRDAIEVPATMGLKMVGYRYHHNQTAAHWEAIAPHLEPVVEDTNAMMTRLELDSWALARFCRWLVDSGKMSANEFERLFTLWLDQPEGES